MIYTNSDGGARGNPGPGAIGVVVRRDGEVLTKHSSFLGKRVTNNEAEYEGLIMALNVASRFTNKEVTCILDSQLVVNQLLGKYRVRHPGLKEKFLKVQQLQENFEKIIYKHAPREDKFQQMADELLNVELDSKGFKKFGYK